MSTVISLSPTMTRRLNFTHDLMDSVDEYALHGTELQQQIYNWIEESRQEGRDAVILGNMWLVKDYVSRFRAHWPETRRFTDDMCGVGLEALTEYVDSLKSRTGFLNGLKQFIHNRIRDFVNDNRSQFSASRATNQRREQEEEPVEYNYAQQLNESVIGKEDLNPSYVDILDSIESLAECDHEEMHDLIHFFLEQEHGIDEASLSDEQRQAIERLSDIGRDLL